MKKSSLIYAISTFSIFKMLQILNSVGWERHNEIVLENNMCMITSTSCSFWTFVLNHRSVAIYKDSAAFQANQNCSIASKKSPNSYLYQSISMLLLRVKSGRGSEKFLSSRYLWTRTRRFWSISIIAMHVLFAHILHMIHSIYKAEKEREDTKERTDYIKYINKWTLFYFSKGKCSIDKIWAQNINFLKLLFKLI